MYPHSKVPFVLLLAGSRNQERVDYRKVLSDDEFQIFCRLRDARKSIAESEGVPLYTVFTNAQLAEIVRANCENMDNLQAIKGLGKGRLAKYGQAILDVLNETGKERDKTE